MTEIIDVEMQTLHMGVLFPAYKAQNIPERRAGGEGRGERAGMHHLGLAALGPAEPQLKGRPVGCTHLSFGAALRKLL